MDNLLLYGIAYLKHLEFKKWSEFRTWIDDDRQIMPVYWRSQPKPSLPLASSFEREILELNGGSLPGAELIYPYGGRYDFGGKPNWEDGFYQAMRDRYIKAFERAATGIRGSTPAILDTDQWWALGRHYGLVTPLLDWSESPYIAAFFSLTELLTKMRTPHGIVYSDQKIAIYRLFHNDQLEGDGLRVLRPMVDELSRMHGQRSVFTWLDSEKYFELQGFLDNTGRGDLLTRVVISDQAVMDGLRDLRAHGIDYRQLFPDLFGAAKHANALWDVF